MWLVIGYGSMLHSDDRFGRDVAEQIYERAVTGRVDVVSANQLTPELAEPISRASGVIFVDASATLPPGSIQCATLVPSVVQDDAVAFTHHCTPEMLLQSARTLFGVEPPAWLCTVGAESFGLGESLSPSVSAAVPQVVAWILDRLTADTATTGETGRT
jgi:hydrogenase maturation protease